MTTVVFPAFAGTSFQPDEMRQLVSALELRFQSLESEGQSLFNTEVVSDGDFASVDHTHTESEITDLQPYLTDISDESIFDLSDVNGTPSNNDVLVWDGSQFLPEAPAGGSVPTHTGEVTGDVNLTVDVTAITNRVDVVADSADDVAIHDDTDGTYKKVNLSSITDAGYF
jgi:hypothetical protein